MNKLVSFVESSKSKSKIRYLPNHPLKDLQIGRRLIHSQEEAFPRNSKEKTHPEANAVVVELNPFQALEKSNSDHSKLK